MKVPVGCGGYVIGIRFYKATANTGVHVGNLWTSNGTQMATVTFSNETTTGWQQALFAAPVAIASNTVYVASYHATNGHYSCDVNYFLGKGMDSPPLHAMATVTDVSSNGVYAYGSSSLFPTQTWNNANYWVDVVFQAGSPPPPTLKSIAVMPTNSSIWTGVSQQFTATGTYSDGSTQNLSNRVTWTSSNPGVATINTNGLATGVSTGTTTISAALGSEQQHYAYGSGAGDVNVHCGDADELQYLGRSLPAVHGDRNLLGWQHTESEQPSDMDLVEYRRGDDRYQRSGHGGLNGTTTISAALGIVSNSTTLTVQAPATLMSIAVTPTNSSILAGASQQFTATGTYSDGSTQSLSNRVTWTSSNTGVATINTSGLATGGSNGTTTISATLGSVTGRAPLTVLSAPLSIITTALSNGIVNAAYTGTLTAAGGIGSNTWSLAGGSLPSGLTLNAVSGVITGRPTASGVFNFTAQVRDSGSPAQTATKPLSISIVMSIWSNTTVPGLADGGADFNGPVELGVKFRSDVTGSVIGIRFYKATANTGVHVGNLWASNGAWLAAVTFSNETTTGWQQALFAAPVAIASNTVYVASYHATNGHYSCDINYFLGKGMDSPPLHAMATVTDVSSNGVYAYGSSSLFPTQTWNNANYWVDVVFQAGSPPPPTLKSIAVMPTNSSILAGASQQFTATGTYSNGSIQNLSNRVMWTSSNTGVATIDTNGLATGVSTGTTTISAALGGVSNSTTLTVQAPATLMSIAVMPTNSSILAGASQQFTATGTYSDGSTQNLSNRVAWTSSNTGVATIDTSGLATGVSNGTTTISAALGIVSNSTTLTVQAPATLMSIAVTPTNSSILAGASQQFTATGTYSDGSTQSLSNRVTWTSSNTGVATINTSGLATGGSNGTTTISATLGSVTGRAPLTVLSAPLSIITTALSNGIVNAAYTGTLTAAGGIGSNTWSLAGGSLPSGLTLNAVSGVITGRPTASGVFNFTAQVRDSGSPAQTATKPLSISIVMSIWSNTTVPGLADGGADFNGPVELGVKFRSDVTGSVIGIRFYKATANTGVHVGNLWASNGAWLAAVTFSNETTTGWQQALFAAPVAIASNTVYVASYHATNGHYSCDINYFLGKGMDSPPLHAMATVTDVSSNGVYAYGSSSLFPTQTWNNANYWVDVVFQAGSSPTLTSIAVTPTNSSIWTEASQQFTATGTYSDGSTQNLSNRVMWTSSNTGVATIDTNGLATGGSNGTTTISAALGGVSNSTTLTVQALPVILTSTNAVTVPEGGTADFQVKLDSAPDNLMTVTVRRVSGDLDIVVQSGTSLVFSVSNWSAEQTVTLRAAADADRTNGSAVIQCSAPGLASNEVMATERDNTPPIILTSTNAVTVPEGGTADFQVKLDSAPDNLMTVTVSRVSGDLDIVVQSGTSLVFSVSNWSAEQTVTLWAVADADRTNGLAVIQCSAPGLASNEVTATERDNTPPVILTSTNAVTVPEGETADFQVKLDSAPDNPTTVTVSRVSGDLDVVVQSGTSLVFSVSNWSAEQTVTLRAAADADRTNGSAVIQCSAPGLATKEVTATEQDSTPPPVILTSTNAVSVPEGGTTEFQVKLDSAPDNSTTVTVSRVSGDVDLSRAVGHLAGVQRFQLEHRTRR